jgi:Predicted AAA-ATPase
MSIDTQTANNATGNSKQVGIAKPSNTPKKSRIDESSLMTNDNVCYFRSGGADFSSLLKEEDQAYFDRTRYISVLAGMDRHILFFRPRRFGKSLTVSMLEHFHGLQYTDEHQSFYEVREHVPDYPGMRN